MKPEAKNERMNETFNERYINILVVISYALSSLTLLIAIYNGSQFTQKLVSTVKHVEHWIRFE